MNINYLACAAAAIYFSAPLAIAGEAENSFICKAIDDSGKGLGVFDLSPENPEVCDYALSNSVGDAMICASMTRVEGGFVFAGDHTLDAVVILETGEMRGVFQQYTFEGDSGKFVLQSISGSCEVKD